MKNQCKWALYKGLWHTECHHYLTTTTNGELVYAFDEIPYDGFCPECKRQVEVIERNFGRRKSD